MKSRFLPTVAVIGAAALAVMPAANAAETPPDCLAVGKSVETAVKADASTVLAVVAAKVTEAPACACDVVKAAIRATKASNELTGQIVEAAVRAAPGQYKTIVECAVAVNAGAAAEMRAALQRVFGGKDGKGGKVVIEAPRTMHPAVAMAFIMDGISPGAALALTSSGLNSGLRTTASIPGGGTSSVFGFENTPPRPPTPDEPEDEPTPPRPRPRPPFGGGSGGGTPTNPN